MTHKDYELIAGVIRDLREGPSGVVGDRLVAVSVVAEAFATRLETPIIAAKIGQRPHPRFDRAKFLKACGY